MRTYQTKDVFIRYNIREVHYFILIIKCVLVNKMVTYTVTHSISMYYQSIRIFYSMAVENTLF